MEDHILKSYLMKSYKIICNITCFVFFTYMERVYACVRALTEIVI